MLLLLPVEELPLSEPQPASMPTVSAQISKSAKIFFITHPPIINIYVSGPHDRTYLTDDQPLTEPIVRPEIMYLWKKGYAQAIGTTINTTRHILKLMLGRS